MSIQDTRKKVEALGLEISSREMQVLQAVLDAQGTDEYGATFKEIQQTVRKLFFYKQKGKKTTGRPHELSRSRIYECLGNLTRDGFLRIEGRAELIQVGNVSNPGRYVATHESIVEGLQNQKDKQIVTLESELQQLSSQRKLLQSASSSRVTQNLIQILAGISPIPKSHIIEGVDNVRRVISEEFIESAKVDDVLRMTFRESPLDVDPSGGVVIERKIIQKAAQGVIVKALVRKGSFLQSRSSDALKDFMRSVGKQFIQAVVRGTMYTRSFQEDLVAFRMVSLNNEKIMLFLTDAPAAETAAIVYLKDNPTLVNDTIESFEEMWEKGEDVANTFRSAISNLLRKK